MAGATLNIRVVQPRLMSQKQAADYVGLPLKRFSTACPAPRIEMPGKVMVYDVRDLDAWVDQIKTGSADPDDAILALLDGGAS